MDDRLHRRITFDTIAEQYDRARSGYPDAVFDDLFSLEGVGPACRVLEVGAGTGKFTEPMARRGHRVTAVELGAGMAEVARRRLAGLDVDIVVADFETWALPASPFDLVVAATAFHWIDPAARWHRAADALRPGGWVGIVTSAHVAGGDDDGFFEAMNAVYVAHVEAWSGSSYLPDAGEIDAGLRGGIEESGRFQDVTVHRHLWDWRQSTAEYIDTIGTRSSHLVMDPAVRERLFSAVAALLDDYGGAVTLRTVSVLTAGRTPGSARGATSGGGRPGWDGYPAS